MATVDVVNWDSKKVGSAELAAEVFEAPVRKDVMHQVVRWQLAMRRQGTHQAKVRGEVSGGGKKPFKQKGTGNARQGTSRSPLMPGGAVVFGPRPRSYEFDLPRKFKQLGLRSALSYLHAQGKVTVVDGMEAEGGKTKAVAQLLKKMDATKAVMIDGEKNEGFYRASRNLPKVRYYSADGLNVYDLLKFDRAFLTKASLEKINARCGVTK